MGSSRLPVQHTASVVAVVRMTGSSRHKRHQVSPTPTPDRTDQPNTRRQRTFRPGGCKDVEALIKPRVVARLSLA